MRRDSIAVPGDAAPTPTAHRPVMVGWSGGPPDPGPHWTTPNTPRSEPSRCPGWPAWRWHPPDPTTTHPPRTAPGVPADPEAGGPPAPTGRQWHDANQTGRRATAPDPGSHPPRTVDPDPPPPTTHKPKPKPQQTNSTTGRSPTPPHPESTPSPYPRTYVRPGTDSIPLIEQLRTREGALQGAPSPRNGEPGQTVLREPTER